MPPAADDTRREVLGAFAITTAGSIGITQLGRMPALAPYEHVAVASLFLWLALRMAQRDARGPEGFGLALGGLLSTPQADQPTTSLFQDLRRALPDGLRELGVALAIATVVFPPFVLGFRLWHQPTRELTWSLPDDPIGFVLAQLLVVGLPEEALFRGYFQTRLTDLLPRAFHLWRYAIPWQAIVVQAVLFALVHFAVDLQPQRLAVLFPGLLFGLLRAVRGGIGAAIAFHALSNLLSDILVRGWL